MILFFRSVPRWVIPALALALVGSLGPARAAERVVIVVIDGLRATEGFADPSFQYIPRMGHDLVPQGAWARACDNMGPTITIPGHAAIGSGRYQQLLDDGTQRSLFPLLWEYYRETTGADGQDVVIVSTKRKIQGLSYSLWEGYGPPDSARVIGPTWDDVVTVNQFLLDMVAARPDVALLNLGRVDIAAHTGDWGEYIWAIGTADSMVALLWNRIQADPNYRNRTDLVISGDHGRHDAAHGPWSEHGDGCPGCRRIPLLCLGPDFPAGLVSDVPCQQNDLCKTVAAVLGIPVPLAGGRVLEELFADPAAVELPDARFRPRLVAQGRQVRLLAAGGADPLRIGIYDPAGRRMVGAGIEGGGSWSWTAPARGIFFYSIESSGEVARGRVAVLR